LKSTLVFLDTSIAPGTSRNALGGERPCCRRCCVMSSGRILFACPADTGGDIYKHVSDSAKAGETQGTVSSRPRATTPPPGRLDQREQRPIKPAPVAVVEAAEAVVLIRSPCREWSITPVLTQKAWIPAVAQLLPAKDFAEQRRKRSQPA